jgi:hypothetical protein
MCQDSSEHLLLHLNCISCLHSINTIKKTKDSNRMIKLIELKQQLVSIGLIASISRNIYICLSLCGDVPEEQRGTYI